MGIEAKGADRITTDLNLIPSLLMPDDPESYLAVLKATYDYEPQPDAEDELAIKENQVLFLIERVDDELSICLFHLYPYLPPDPNRSPQLVEGQTETRR